MFVHSHKIDGVEFCGANHATVPEARECSAAAEEAAADVPSCPVCDANGCGADGYGCRRYEVDYRVRNETADEEAMTVALFGPATSEVDLCGDCGVKPAGHGHFAQYCEPCSELPLS